MIDLRSDTVTRPTREMYEAMMNAPVGDDVFGEDPTINMLQFRAAEMFGKEAALFCPSGTMTNQIAIQVHCSPGDEVICSELAHIYLYEGGGIAKNAGASVRLLKGDKGRISPLDIEKNINPPDSHYPRTSLVAVEDTCNKGGGSCYSFEDLEQISQLSRKNGLAFHLDGARVFNAIVKEGHDMLSYGKLFDSISICLSKGLGAPVGSVLLGSAEFIKEAHRIRKGMGGGMRQAGIVAAAGLYALENYVDRLAEDHEKAKKLADTLETCSYVREVVTPETNIVIFSLKEGIFSGDVVTALGKVGVSTLPFGPEMIRFVTHYDVSMEEIDKCCSILKELEIKKASN